MLICFEGLDGVGKSTIANQVSRDLEIKKVEKPLKNLLFLNGEQSKNITEQLYSRYSSNVQAMYYLMGYLSVLEDSRKEDLIMDRGFLSTYYFSFNENNRFIFNSLIENYGGPDLNFILYASIEERIRRIKVRNSSDKDLNKGRIYTDGYDKFFQCVESYNLPYILINTERMASEQVITICNRITQIALNDGNIASLRNLFSISNLESLEYMSYENMNKAIDDTLHGKVYRL